MPKLYERLIVPHINIDDLDLSDLKFELPMLDGHTLIIWPDSDLGGLIYATAEEDEGFPWTLPDLGDEDDWALPSDHNPPSGSKADPIPAGDWQPVNEWEPAQNPQPGDHPPKPEHKSDKPKHEPVKRGPVSNDTPRPVKRGPVEKSKGKGPKNK